MTDRSISEDAGAVDRHPSAACDAAAGAPQRGTRRIAKEIVDHILDHVCEHPRDGSGRVAFELDIRGVNVSAGGVYSLWRRMDLQTVDKRLAYAKEHAAERMARRQKEGSPEEKAAA